MSDKDDQNKVDDDHDDDDNSEDNYYNKLQAHADNLSNYESDKDVTAELNFTDPTVFENDEDYYNYINNKNTLSDVGILPENDIIWQELLRNNNHPLSKINKSMDNSSKEPASLFHSINLEIEPNCSSFNNSSNCNGDMTVTLLLLEQWLFSHLPSSSRLYVLLRNRKVAFSSSSKVSKTTVNELSSSSSSSPSSSSKSFTQLYVDHLHHPSFIMIVNKKKERKGTLYVSCFSGIPFTNSHDEVIQSACDILFNLLTEIRTISCYNNNHNNNCHHHDNTHSVADSPDDIKQYQHHMELTSEAIEPSSSILHKLNDTHISTPTPTTHTHWIESLKPSLEFDAVSDGLLNTMTTCLININTTIMTTNTNTAITATTAAATTKTITTTTAITTTTTTTAINSPTTSTTAYSNILTETWRVQAGLFVHQSPRSINSHDNQNNDHDLSEDYEFCELNADRDAMLINESWKYHSELSIDMVRTMIANYACIGIQKKSTSATIVSDGFAVNDDDYSKPVVVSTDSITDSFPQKSTTEQQQQQMMQMQSSPLVCWCLTYADGAIGMLHTLEKHRQKGLARSVVKKLIPRWLEYQYGCLPFCYIEEGNYASLHLFSSLGFTRAEDQSWANIEYQSV